MTSSISPIHPLQVAVYELFTGDATLMGLATGGVYDQVPEHQPKPYIRIGDHLSIPDNDHGGFGREVTETFHVFTRARGNATGQAIAARIIALLDHQLDALDVEAHRVVSIRCEFDQALPDPDPEVRHHVVRMRICTEQEEQST